MLKVKGHYSNPHISYDSKHWYLSVGYEVEAEKVELTGESIGIDFRCERFGDSLNRQGLQKHQQDDESQEVEETPEKKAA